MEGEMAVRVLEDGAPLENGDSELDERFEGDGGDRGEEEREEEDGGEEEEEEEEEEGYTFHFDGDMDPIGFAQDDNHGIELYQKFERLEYEALAERKRKALQEQERPAETIKKSRREDVLYAAMEDMNELMNFGRRRRRRAPKKRGRKKGSKSKLPPEVDRKMRDATLHCASKDYNVAIPLLEEIVRLAPNLSEAYYMLGFIYHAKGDREKALGCDMIAAHLSPKDSAKWKKIIAQSPEQENIGQVRYCLMKAITADPKDVSPRFTLAFLYYGLGEYQKAAESYDQICGINPANTQAREMAAKMYRKCGMTDQAIRVLEDYVKDHHSICNKNVVNLLIECYMQNGSHKEALKLIEHAYSMCDIESENTLYLKMKEVVCHAQLGNMQQTEDLLKGIQTERSDDNGVLISEVADSFLNLRQYHYALKFYLMLEDIPNHANGNIHLKIAECFLSMKERGKAITFYYKALSKMEDSIDARIILSSLLLEDGKVQETINLLSPPQKSKQIPIKNSAQSKPWWENGKIKMQLAKIYHSKGMLEDFVDTIYTCIHETLVIELVNRKVRRRKKLPKSVLFERVKLLDEQDGHNVFGGFRPVAKASELGKAHRAKKSLQQRAILKEEKKAAALAAGWDWQSDSEDETLINLRKTKQEPPLPDFLNEQDHLQFTLHLCKALVSMRRYSEALELINHTLKLEYNTISDEKREEFRSLGAHIAYSTTDPKHGYDYVRYIVKQHPHSVAAWNCYNKVISRFDSRFARHIKFLLHMRVEQKDCVMPMVIHGNQFTMISQHQAAAAEYLEAYKVQPDNPLINLCVGTSLINLSLGFRLQKKHNCIAQGFAFLYNYLHISNDSQEALYNIARAYHHVGLVTLAASYYEKALAMHVKDYPIPKLPYEDSNCAANKKPGYCNLHREAAYNLHLIYKKSGAMDLARQVLKRYCTL